MISSVERGSVNPSIDVILRLCKSLGIDFNSLIHDDRQPQVAITRRDNHYSIVDENAKSYLVSPLFGRGNCAVLVSYLNPKKQMGRGHVSPNTYELIVVVKGKVVFLYGDEEFTLEAGDSVYFHANCLHFVRNISSQQAVLVWLVFSEKELPQRTLVED